MQDYKIQFEKITKNCKDLVSKEELTKALQKSIETKKPLKIKVGFDPTYPHLHLGHLALLKKLKIFQNLGHEVIFLIGDFTASIGDPSGKDEMRPSLTPREIKINTKTYTDQVFTILNKKKTKVLYNSKWLKKMSSSQWVELCSLYTVSRMLERDDFSKRFKDQKPIYIHEFLYPLVQGYDSYVIEADIELGGTDQIFNLLMGREVQKHFNQKPQCLLTFPLLKGLDGQKKMSKSLNNFIAIQDSPKDMYGKILSLSDDLMLHYYELLFEDTDIKATHPLVEKKRLARLIVSELHGAEKAQKAELEFEKVFSSREMPDQMPETFAQPRDNVWICHLLKELNMLKSAGEARRLIQGGGIRINGDKITDTELKVSLKSNSEWIFQIGKRIFLKVKVK